VVLVGEREVADNVMGEHNVARALARAFEGRGLLILQIIPDKLY